MVDKTRVAKARYRRSPQAIGRERIGIEETRHTRERWADVVDAAQRRLHERRVWHVVQEAAAPVRAEMEKNHRGEWAELKRRQEAEIEGDEAQHRREQGREARQFEEEVGETYREGGRAQPGRVGGQPRAGGRDRAAGRAVVLGRTSFEVYQREAREAGRPPPEIGHDRGGGFDMSR